MTQICGGDSTLRFRNGSVGRFRLLSRRLGFFDRRRPAVLTSHGWLVVLAISAALVLGGSLAFAL